MDVCTILGQTDGQTNGHPTVIIKQCYGGRTSDGRLSAEVGCTAVGPTQRQTDGHPTVVIRAYDVGYTIGVRLHRCTSGGRLSTDGRVHSCRTDRQTD